MAWYRDGSALVLAVVVLAQTSYSQTPDSACGTSKGCFSSCSATSCDFLVTWVVSGQNIDYTLSTSQSGASRSYVALGMSTDVKMGGDYVLGCTLDTDDSVTLFTGRNPGGYSATQSSPDAEVSLVSRSTTNGLLTCTIRRPIAANANTNRNDASQQFYYFLARGTPPSASSLSYHGQNKFVSSKMLSSTISTDNLGNDEPAQPSNPTTLTPDSACGTSKGCFSSCSATSCDFLVTWEVSGQNVDYTLSTSQSGASRSYVALGMSTDDKMGGDYVLGCILDTDDSVTLFTGRNPGGYTQTQSSPDAEVSLVSSSTTNGLLTCTIRRPIAANANTNRNDASQQFYYLLARGAPSSASALSYHGENKFVSSKMLDSTISTDNLAPVVPIDPSQAGTIATDPECGVSKGCFTSCGGDSCSFVVSWQKQNDTSALYTIQSRVPLQPPVYVALGFSSDDRMGSDSVIGCAVDSSSNVRVFNSYNPGKRSSIIPTEGTTLMNGKFEDSVLLCNFQQNIGDSTDSQRVNVDKSWRLLLARGKASFDSDAVNRVSRHPSGNTFVSSQSVSVSENLDLTASSVDKPLVKAHGSLMIGAWVFFASLGIIAARYYKPVWKDLLFSQKVWFQIHRLCMVLVFCTTVAGFVIIFVEVEEWSDIHPEDDKEYLKGHPIIGVIVMGLTVLNPLMALIRPHPGTPKRPIFNWCHWFVGTSAHILGVVAIFFGLELFEQAEDSLTYIMAAFVGWHVLVELVLTAVQCCSKSRNKKEVYEMSNDGSPVAPPDEESGQLITFKKFVLVAHFLVVTSLTAVLIGLLAKD